MLSVNSAIVALYGDLQTDKLAVPAAQKMVWLWAIPAAGAIVCVAWAALLTSYRKLNRAKFTVLQETKESYHFILLRARGKLLGEDRRRVPVVGGNSNPGCFVLLYLAMLVAAIVTRGT